MMAVRAEARAAVMSPETTPICLSTQR
jgi:hypothetical protein